MIARVLKYILCIIFLDYISTNSVASVNENRIAPFTGGYEYYENLGYYKLYYLKTTWGYAWKQCREDGAHLVVIDSNEEHNIVREMVKQTNEDAFIGVHDLFFEGSFFTVTGKPLVPSSYNMWDEGQPNNYGDQDCVLMVKDGDGKIRDGNCDENNNFICEFELDQDVID